MNLLADILDFTVKELFLKIKDFLYNPIVASVIGGLIGLYLSNIRNYIKRLSKHRKIWFFKKEKNIYIFTGSIKQNNDKLPTMQLGDIKSFALILGTITTLYPNVNIFTRLSEQEAPDISGQTVVTIGGGRWNSVTRKLYNELNWPFKVFRNEENEAYIKDMKSEKQYFVEKNSDGEITKVYGLFLKGINPQSPSKYVYIVSGLSTFGVNCATKFFSVIDPFERVNFNEVNKKIFWRTNLFAVLISSKVSNGNVYDPRIVSLYKFKWKDLLN